MRKTWVSRGFQTGLALFLAVFLFIPVALASSAVGDTEIKGDAALKMLQEGNQRFVQSKLNNVDLSMARRVELSKGQHPFAVIVTCSDSRVAPELVFNQGLGDLFVVRVAGNVLDSIELGSVEYAVEHLHAHLVVVMGHEKCGAVKATVDGGEVPDNIKAIANKIQPAVAAAKAKKAADVYEAATDNNVANMVTLIKGDPVLAHMPGVRVIGAKYHLESGDVSFTE